MGHAFGTLLRLPATLDALCTVFPFISGRTSTIFWKIPSLSGLWRLCWLSFLQFRADINDFWALSRPKSQKLANMAKLLNVLALLYYSKNSDSYKTIKNHGNVVALQTVRKFCDKPFPKGTVDVPERSQGFLFVFLRPSR